MQTVILFLMLFHVAYFYSGPCQKLLLLQPRFEGLCNESAQEQQPHMLSLLRLPPNATGDRGFSVSVEDMQVTE